MKQLTKPQENTYMAVVSQRGKVLDSHGGRYTPTKVAVAVLTVKSDSGVKNHIVAVHPNNICSLNSLSWDKDLDNVVLSTTSVGPNLDLRNSTVSEGIEAFNKANTKHEFTGRSYVLTDVLVF